MLLTLLLAALAHAQSDPALISAVPEEAADAEPPSVVVRDDGVIRLEGVPLEDPALRQRLRRFQHVRAASLVGVAPDGESILVRTRLGEVGQLHRVDGPGGARQQLTFGDEPVVGAATVPNSRDFTYRVDVGGDEQFQVVRQGVGGTPRLLTDGRSRHSRYLWDDAGRRLAFTSTARDGNHQHLWIGDGRTPAHNRPLVQEEGDWLPLDFSADGTELLVTHSSSATRTGLWVVDVGTGERTRLDDGEQTGDHPRACFGADANTVYVATDARGELRQLFEVDRALEAWRPLTAELPHDVDELALSPDGRTLAFTLDVEGGSELHLLDTRKRRHAPAKGLPHASLSELTFPGEDPRTLFFTLSGPTLPGDVHRLDLRRGRLERWTFSELGPLDPNELVAPELGRTATGDVPYFLYRPAGEGPFPVVVRFRGDPEGQARPEFSGTAQYLATEGGIAVLIASVPGNDWLDAVDDVDGVLDHIEHDPGLDAHHVGVFGEGFGGSLVLAALTTYPDRIQAGVATLGGSAALADVSDIRAALMVAHGANDPRVAVREVAQLVAAVREQGQDVWYFLARNEGHGLSKKQNRDRYELLMLQFFTRHLN